MTWLRLSADTFGAGRRPLLLEADSDTSWAAVAAAVAPLANGAPLLLDGQPPAGDATLGLRPLRDGTRFGRPTGHAAAPPPGTVLLAVVNGPATGRFLPLPPRQLQVGRNEPFVLEDPEVSRVHCTIDRSADGTVTVADGTLGGDPSRNGTLVNGTRLPASHGRRAAGTVLVPGDVIRIGQTALTLVAVPVADAALNDDDAGGLDYNRPPRHRPAATGPALTWPKPPAEAAPHRLDLITVAAPVVVGVVMALLLHRVEFLLFTAITPIVLIGRWLADRRRNGRQHRSDSSSYASGLLQAEQHLIATLAAEAVGRRAAAPHAVDLLLAAELPTSRLWERRAADPDAYSVRIGLGPADPLTTVEGRPGQPLATLAEIPQTLRLPDVGGLGIAGGRQRARELARWVVTQLCALHSPDELRVALLCADPPDRTQPDWDFVRWLPHARPNDAAPVVSVGSTAEGVGRQLDMLAGIVEARQQARADHQPAWLVVLDGGYDLRLANDLDRLLVAGPPVGVYFVCLDDSPTRLPAFCGAYVELTGTAAAEWVGDGMRRPFIADLVDSGYAERIAHALAPIRDVGRRRSAGGLPQRVLLTEVAGRRLDDPDGIADGWRKGGRSTRALLGVAAHGPYELDLALGPHLLIGGITGAGKSQLLITLVTGLALVNRPDALNFVLVDYKGKAAFRAVEHLPHVVGTVTDLTPQLTRRALTSFRAEIERRKVILDLVGVSSIEQYWALRDSGAPAAADPLPRLVIVVDEFAKLAADLPGFIESLVGVAAQGRSFGVHLVLATQRPSTSVISADISANIGLRIALRTASDVESQLIIDAPDAARIPVDGHGGRAYVRIGHEAPVAIQTALSTSGAGRSAGPRVIDWPWDAVDLAPPAVTPDGAADEELARIVGSMIDAAEQSGLRAGRPIWLDPLPAVLPLAELAAVADGVPFGRRDLPASQRQETARLDLDGGGHLLVGGAPGSGRTTLLRTLAASAGAIYSPDLLGIYGIDGGGGLAVLETLPQTVAVTAPHESERMARLLARLAAEVDRRRRLFAEQGCSTLREFRLVQPLAVLPHLLVLVDSYEALQAALTGYDAGSGLANLAHLLRQGYAAGVVCVVAGDRGLLISRLATPVADRLVLPLSSPADYQAVGVPIAAIPDKPTAGTAVAQPGLEEVQVAVLGSDPSGIAQQTQLRASAVGRPTTAAVPRVDRLPEQLTDRAAAALPTMAGIDLPIAVGGDQLMRVGFDLSGDGPGIVVVGASRSGKTTTLAVAARAAVAAGWPVLAVTPLDSAPLHTVLPAHAPRLGGSASAEDLAAALERLGRPTCVLVDDAEALFDAPLGLALTQVLRAGRQSGHRLIVAAAMNGNPLVRGLLLEARASRSGLLLDPRPALGTVLDIGTLPEWACGGGVGRAAFVRRGQVLPAVVPLPAVVQEA